MTEQEQRDPAVGLAAREAEAEKVVRTHVMWAMGAGLMPFPLFDIAAVTAVQMDMLKQLAGVYGIDYSNATGKTFAGSLTGGAFAHVGASLLKFVPGIGTVLGGLSMSVMSGASTYAVGSVARAYFSSGSGFAGIDIEEAKRRYAEDFERGKGVAKDLASQMKGSSDKYRVAFEGVQKLSDLRDKELLTDEEFEDVKRKLLERL